MKWRTTNPKGGQFFRQWAVPVCLERIREAGFRDLDDLREALVREQSTSRPRRRLVSALRRRILDLPAPAHAQEAAR